MAMMTQNPFGTTQTVPNWMNNNMTGTPYMQQTQPTPSATQNGLMTIFVNSEDEVNNYPVAAGLTVLLISFNLKKFWLKATDTSGIQAIMDKLCQQEIDALKTQNANLQTQLNMQNLAASQATQTAQLIQDNNAQTAALINRIAPYPVPSYQVANPYVNNSCGCFNNSNCCGNV